MRKLIANKELLKILLTGRSGSTKTRTAYSAALDPRMGSVLGLNAFGQPRSIADYSVQPDLIDIEAIGDLTTIYNWIIGGQKASDPIVRDMGLTPPYHTLVLDGFTEIQKLAVAQISGNSTKGPGDKPAQVEIQHYNTILAQTTAIASRFYKLPMHIIGTVLEDERQEGENGPVTARHLLVGQARQQLSSYAEVVGRCVHIERTPTAIKQALKNEITEDTISVCMFKPSSRYEAKDQTGALGQIMVDPTIGKILDLIEAAAFQAVETSRVRIT